MTIAILDPFSGISGDMTLGALVDVGLEPDWLRELPAILGIPGVGVRVRDVRRGEIACKKVDFDIPAQPHGRSIVEIQRLVEAAPIPEPVRRLATETFKAIASCEGAIHGVDPETVHLHEVGAVDAILDVVGAIWGFERLGVTDVYCGPIALGDGTVRAAHGLLPVPAPATLKLLEGLSVRPGPPGSGELVTPTGAALVQALTRGKQPQPYVPRRSGFGAGTKDFPDRANALRIILADPAEAAADGRTPLVLLAADVDDMSPEYLALAAEALRKRGALDVVLLPTVMKKGRAGTRIEVLADETAADALERLLLTDTTTLGVRRSQAMRRALPRESASVIVDGQTVRLKIVTRPDGRRTAKAELEDVTAAAAASGQSVQAILRAVEAAAERDFGVWV